jgi:hypothetical protein
VFLLRRLAHPEPHVAASLTAPLSAHVYRCCCMSNRMGHVASGGVEVQSGGTRQRPVANRLGEGCTGDMEWPLPCPAPQPSLGESSLAGMPSPAWVGSRPGSWLVLGAHEAGMGCRRCGSAMVLFLQRIAVSSAPRPRRSSCWRTYWPQVRPDGRHAMPRR